ncbi:MAG: DUF1289 domain-containing protein [Rhodobacteraceae bacterium]|nr:DUF1289 domain-containing protein [Paracoccaceae bacterium]
MSKLPSPCLDICKHKIRGGYCIACGMTKQQKRLYDGIRDEASQRAFIEDLMAQQQRVKSAKTWPMEYAGKCARQGVNPPFTLSDG